MTDLCKQPYPKSRLSTAKHLTFAGRGGWSLWRTLECRTAGFPSALVLDLANNDCARLADALADTRTHVRSLFDAVRAELKERIRTALAPGSVPTERGETSSLGDLRAAVKALDRRRLDHDSLRVIGHATLSKLREALRQVDELETAFVHRYASVSAEISTRLSEMAREPTLREAVTWQSKHLVSQVLDQVAESSPGASALRNEELVASYLQRYCVKNDTIGFFGPVGWATWDESRCGAEVHLAAHRLSARTVYFEDWAMQALADRLSADKRLRPWMVPTLAPYVLLDGERLRFPGNAVVALTRQQATLLEACRNGATAGLIADALLQNPFCEFDDEREVLDELSLLSYARWIHFGYSVCLGDTRPGLRLRHQLEAITDPVLRNVALAPLELLEAARDKVAASAGNPDELLTALHRLDTAFEQVTGHASTRSAGQTYGARTVVYEDCQRAAEVCFGGDVLCSLQDSLELVLTSARWFCHETARIFREALAEVFLRIAHRTPSGVPHEIDMPTFWLHAQELFYGEGPAKIATLRRQLTEKWQELLRPNDGGDVRRRSAALAPRVEALFGVSDSGWVGAMHQSPDVMIAARDVDAIARGEAFFVLGEVHVGINTLINYSALDQHPDANQVLDALHEDLGRPRVMPRISRVGTGQPIRVQTVADVRRDVELMFSLGALPLRVETAIDLAELVVRYENDGLTAVTRDGTRHYDLLDLFAQLLSGFVANKFRMLPTARQSPRVTIDRLVVQRRTWRIPCEELTFISAKDPALVFLELRRWAATQGLPRWTFFKANWEKKPFYLDLDSPIFVRMFAKQVRNALKRDVDRDGSIVLTEMLPSHDELWMPLEPGVVCTSELRLVAVHNDDRRTTEGRP